MLDNVKKFFIRLRFDIKYLRETITEEYIQRQMLENPRYQNPKRLNRHEHQVFSQNGEDGIISEILKRIGVKNMFFVEFGAGSGLENNSAFLLLKGFKGYWIEADEKQVKELTQRFDLVIRAKRLTVRSALITAENIEQLFKDAEVPEDFDLLSIDIDGNDYWVWKAIENYHPRVVVIEYNAVYPPDFACVMKYDPAFISKGTSHFGASLKALEILGLKKGYRLVGCDFRGINAFFVRQDLVSDKFLEPFTAENHYEPPRYHFQTKPGHPREFGDVEIL
jgi:hypothetical protein